MAFVKLDTGILDSTLWVERDARDLFVTALLMAEPFELLEPAQQLKIGSSETTGWTVPPGNYGFVRAASTGILRRALVDNDPGLEALSRLGEPDRESRTPDFEGRRLVRIDGGFIVLNYFLYRDRDYTAAIRQRRYRERKKDANGSDALHRDATDFSVTSRNIYASSSASLSVLELTKEGIQETYARDWLKSRKTPLTVTAWMKVKSEAEKAGMSPNDAVRTAAENGWRGFKADWIEGPKKNKQVRVEDENRNAAAEWLGGSK